jgi:hypothetical protein
MVKLLRAISGRNDSEFRDCRPVFDRGVGAIERDDEHLSARSAPQQYRRVPSVFASSHGEWAHFPAAERKLT